MDNISALNIEIIKKKIDITLLDFYLNEKEKF
jgi:hypothetical protein